MSNTIGRIIDVIGTITIFGLLLSYGPEAAQLIATIGREVRGLYGQVALLDVRPTGPRVQS